MSWYPRMLSFKRKKILVGITSRSHEDNFQWLKEFVMKEYLDLLEVRYFPITNNNRRDWEEAVRTCSTVILYHTKHQGRVNVTDVDGSLYDTELSYLNHYLGKENVLVVLDDMDDISDIERQRILKAQRSLERLSSHLILIPERDKTEAANRKLEELCSVLSEGVRRSPMEEERPEHRSSSSKTSEPSSLIKSIGNINIKNLGKYLPTNPTPSKSSAPSRPRPPHRTCRVGIFSRAADSNYTWLVDGLKTDGRLRSADIRAFYISNHYTTFRSGLQQCHFAILYHTKKQGRINITDVTDSLYDQELQEMSEFLGKQNVIVVVDDLESSGPEVKDRILDSQLSIRKFARDLFLFTEAEKQTKNLEEIRGIIQRRLTNWQVSVTAQQTEPHRDVKNTMGKVGSSVDSENRIQDPVPTRDFPPSSSGSVDCHTTPQKIVTAEPQSKIFKKSDYMDVKVLPVTSFSDLHKTVHIQPEKEELTQKMFLHEETNTTKRTIEEREKKFKDKDERAAERESVDGQEIEIREEANVLQEGEAMILGGAGSIHGQEEEIIEEDKVLHEGEANVQEVDIGMETSFQKREERSQVHRTPQEHERFPEKGHHIKENLQNTAGSKLEKMINEKDCEIQRLREENRRLRDEIRGMNNEQLTYKLLLSECRCQKKLKLQ